MDYEFPLQNALQAGSASILRDIRGLTWSRAGTTQANEGRTTKGTHKRNNQVDGTGTH